MNKEQAKLKLAELQKSAQELQAIIDSPDMQVTVQGRFMVAPAGDTIYFCVDSSGDVFGSKWDNFDTDYNRLKSGKCFATREAAEQSKRYDELWQEWRVARAEEGGEVDWVNNKLKYTIELIGNNIHKDFRLLCFEAIHFLKEETRDKFFDDHSEDELRLMIMGVQ